MEKIDKAALELLESLPQVAVDKLSSAFGITKPASWDVLDEDDKLLWLNEHRQQISQLIAELASQLEVVSRALVGKAKTLELVGLWRYKRKIS